MNSKRQTTNDRGGAVAPWVQVPRRTQVVAGRWPLIVALALLVLSLLAACSSATPSQTIVQGSQSGGSVSPEAVTQSFFDDLGAVLKDPQLANDKQRGVWAEQLANYFAPTERDALRIALGSMLDNFAGGLDKLAANESLTFELKINSLQKISETSDRAMVQVDGVIHVQITRSTNTSVLNLYDDTVSLDKIIGGANGAVPAIRIGRSWYLTEG